MISSGNILSLAISSSIGGGGSSDLIAIGTESGKLFIYSFHHSSQYSTTKSLPLYSLLAVIQDTDCPIWSVKWNLTGTVLATSSDDGLVRIYKKEKNAYQGNDKEKERDNGQYTGKYNFYLSSVVESIPARQING